MIACVDVSPNTTTDTSLPRDTSSWAPILDAATSICSTLFFSNPRLRMPAQVSQVLFHPSALPPKVGYIHVLPASSNKDLVVTVDVLDTCGHVLVHISEMRFAKIEGTIDSNSSVESLVHQISWPPMQLSEKPLALGHVMVISRDRDAVERSQKALKTRAVSFTAYRSVNELCEDTAPSSSGEKQTAIMLYLPENVASFQAVAEAGSRFCSNLLDIVKHAASISLPVKVFVITSNVMKGETATALAHAPLHGLGAS